MARTAAMARRTTVVRRGVSPKKLERALASKAAMQRRARTEAKRREREVVSVGASALYGLAIGRDMQIPTFGNVEPALLWGAGFYVLPELLKMGSAGQYVKSGGVGLLSVAAYNVAKTGSLEATGYDDFEDH